jgi:hypothetical protein
MDVNRQPAFISSVVPLGQVRSDLCTLGEAGKLAGPSDADKRAYKYPGKPFTLQSRAKQSSVFLSAGIQRNIGAAGVFARVGPIGIAVTDQEEAWRMLCFLCGQGS